MADNFGLSQLVQPKAKKKSTGLVGDDIVSAIRGLVAGKGNPPSTAKPPTPPVFTVGKGTPKGLVALGNVDIAHRPSVFNPETGKNSTVWSMSIGTDQGEVLIPRVSDDGRILTEQQAIDQYEKTGKHLGIFSSIEAANAYAEALHNQQESMGLPNVPALRSKSK